MRKRRKSRRFEWWNEARFGIFWVWGCYAVNERGELGSLFERTPLDEYKKFADGFKPKKDFAHDWMELHRRAGARYAVLTAKYCDGYALFDTKSSDYSAPKTGPGRDLVAEYVDACRKAGVRIGIYFNPTDWRFSWSYSGPEPKTAKHREWSDVLNTQIEELCTNYGPIDLWWWDGGPPGAEKIVKKMRKWQPNMMMNNRAGQPYDFACGEKVFPPAEERRGNWEMCLTSNEHWGYFKHDHCWISLSTSIHHMTWTGGAGGNFLYCIGPKASGDIPAPARRIFEGMGAWLKQYGESYYGKGPSTIKGGCAGFVVAKGKTAYLHIHFYASPHYVLLSPGIRVRSATVMKTGQRLTVKHEGERVILTGLPPKPPDVHDTVVVLKTDRPSEA
jgi:alpha-L-fucosidase